MDPPPTSLEIKPCPEVNCILFSKFYCSRWRTKFLAAKSRDTFISLLPRLLIDIFVKITKLFHSKDRTGAIELWKATVTPEATRNNYKVIKVF
jgi:hypothetical protein